MNSEFHGSDGKFKKGNPGNPLGNPEMAKIAAYKRALHQALSMKKVKEIIVKMAELAVEGDVQAARLLLSYAMGRPKEHVEIEQSGQPIVIEFREK